MTFHSERSKDVPVRIYKLLMFGDREWTNADAIERELFKVFTFVKRTYARRVELVVIEGKAPGADTLAGYVAKNNNIHVCEVGALWETRHRGAGPQRNAIMAALAPNEGVGFHRNIAKSHGTKDMKGQLDKLGIPCRIVRR